MLTDLSIYLLHPFWVFRIISLKYINNILFFVVVVVLLSHFSTCDPSFYFKVVEESLEKLCWNSSVDIRKNKVIYKHWKKAKPHIILHMDTRIGLTHKKTHLKCKTTTPKSNQKKKINKQQNTLRKCYNLTSTVINITQNTVRLNLSYFK